MGHDANAGEQACEQPGGFKRHRNADPLSFVFFIGIIATVLLVPVAIWRREDLPHE